MKASESFDEQYINRDDLATALNKQIETAKSDVLDPERARLRAAAIWDLTRSLAVIDGDLDVFSGALR